MPSPAIPPREIEQTSIWLGKLTTGRLAALDSFGAFLRTLFGALIEAQRPVNFGNALIPVTSFPTPSYGFTRLDPWSARVFANTGREPDA